MSLDPRTWFKVPHHGRYDPESIRSFTEIYWRTLLITGVTICLGALVYGWEQFLAIQGDRSPDAQGIPALQQNIDRAGLQAILDTFKARSARFDAIGASKETISDPSH